MIHGYDIVCFSNDWDGDPLSKKHIMTRLAAKNRVLWVNSIGNRNPTASVSDCKRILRKLWQFLRGCRRVRENLYVFSPIAIPFHGSPVAQWLNRQLLTWSLRRACRGLGFSRPITWTFLPTSADAAIALNHQLLIYHCVDEFSEFTGADREAILEMERRLMQKADLVIVSSNRLLEAKSAVNPRTYLVTHGVDLPHFRQALHAQTELPADLARIPRPRIGFYGLIADWVDLELIRDVATARPQWSFVLVGKADTDTSALQSLPNVHLLGRKDYKALPAYCKGFDVAILPFVMNELTLAANPLKLREYLAAGLPVVSSPIPEVKTVNSSAVRIASGSDQFLKEIQRLLLEGNTGPDPSIARSMEGESWDAKVADLSRIVLSHEARFLEEQLLAS